MPLVFLQVREVGDGNINYVYIVEGPSGAVVLKQGLPYIRIAHDWPLTQVPISMRLADSSISLSTLPHSAALGTPVSSRLAIGQICLALFSKIQPSS